MPKPIGPPRDAQLIMKLTQAERALIERLALRRGQTMSDFVRQAVHAVVAKEETAQA
jgi:uncharacterized protein (DUF1778 family)